MAGSLSCSFLKKSRICLGRYNSINIASPEWYYCRNHESDLFFQPNRDVMIKKIQNLVEEMSLELPHILAVAVVTVDDGMSIAETSRREGLETAAASAYLASIVKSNS